MKDEIIFELKFISHGVSESKFKQTTNLFVFYDNLVRRREYSSKQEARFPVPFLRSDTSYIPRMQKDEDLSVRCFRLIQFNFAILTVSHIQVILSDLLEDLRGVFLFLSS